MKNTLTKEQENLIKEIMEKNSPQRQVDKIVEKTKVEMLKQEGHQVNLDKVFEE